LAKAETRTEASRAGKAVAVMAAGAVAALLMLTLASFALAELLDQGLNRALSFAIVAVVWAIVAAVAISVGRSRLRQVRPLPETTRSLKEDKEWAKNLTS
jgi:chromate transport protein ChrA